MTHTIKIAFFICCIVLGSAGCLAESQQGCSISKTRVQRISDFERAAVRKVMPEYPFQAKRKGVAGTVQLKLLIDKSGHVSAACPVYAHGTTKPDRTLIAAARKAALQWEFPPNFGLQGNLHVKFDYAELFVAFKFAPSRPPELEGKEQAGDIHDK